MPTLCILCGLPFSGKTSLGKRIAKRVGGVLISQDDIMADHHASTGWWLVWEDGLRLMEERAAQALKEVRPVVCDSLYETRQMRDHAKTVAANCGASAVLVYLNTPLDVIHERARANEITRDRHPFSASGFAEVASAFQLPDLSEGAVEVALEADMILRVCLGGSL